MPTRECETSPARPVQLCHDPGPWDSGFLRGAGHFDCLVAWAIIRSRSWRPGAIARRWYVERLVQVVCCPDGQYIAHLTLGSQRVPSCEAQATISRARSSIWFHGRNHRWCSRWRSRRSRSYFSFLFHIDPFVVVCAEGERSLRERKSWTQTRPHWRDARVFVARATLRFYRSFSAQSNRSSRQRARCATCGVGASCLAGWREARWAPFLKTPGWAMTRSWCRFSRRSSGTSASRQEASFPPRACRIASWRWSRRIPRERWP